MSLLISVKTDIWIELKLKNMINTFIAALVALFFWGKSSKDLDEKTQLASWVRTCVYGVLAFLVLVFYIKTYQVATVFNTIQVIGVKETVNAKGQVADSIATIELVNKFSSNITENFAINKLDDSGADELRKVSEAGGLFLALNLHNRPSYKVRKNPKLEKMEREMKAINGYVPEISFGDYPLDAYRHAYLFNYMTSSIPSLIPFFPTYKNEKKYGLDNYGIYQEMIMSDCDSYGGGLTSSAKIRDIDGNTHEVLNKDFLHEMYVGNTIICDTITNIKDYHYKFHFVNNFIQNMNFFTAADISQYTCDINIESDCYIKRMKIMYDLPIEINSQDSNMIMTSYSFILKGDFLNKVIANQGGYRFHVKFPTLANLQLIRSLILTTLLTALVSLFFCNLFYLFRKYVISFKDKHILEISVEKTKIFRNKMFFLAYVIMAFVVYVTWRIYKERPFHIDIKTCDWLFSYYIWVILAILFILCVLLYFLFRKAYSIKKKDKK